MCRPDPASKCTSDQVLRSDSRPTVAGTFVWSGFDYMGEVSERGEGE